MPYHCDFQKELDGLRPRKHKGDLAGHPPRSKFTLVSCLQSSQAKRGSEKPGGDSEHCISEAAGKDDRWTASRINTAEI